MKRFNILIIDDDRESISSLKNILSANGFSIDVATTIQKCFELIENKEFDLILLELSMVGDSDFDISSTLKNSVQNNDVPVIFLTANNDPENIEKGFENGFIDYISKPFRGKELMIRLMNHIELRYGRELNKNLNSILEEKILQRTSELEESLQNLSQAKKELESLSVAKSQLLNLISHEIRTPLNGIIGSMTLIGQYEIPEEINRYFNLLDISVKRLEKFSNAILETSKLRLNGKNILERHNINIVEILSETEKPFMEKYRTKAIKTKFDIKISEPTVFADKKFLLKCFDALLDNAYKFTPSHGKIYIKVFENDENTLSVNIADSGPGFSKSALEYLFQPLGNLESHVDQNTGMGLYMAKVIIDSHSGKIIAGNSKTRGAFVEVALPKS